MAIFSARIAKSLFIRLLTAQLLPGSGLPLQTMRGRLRAENVDPGSLPDKANPHESRYT
jgi:hypothetical protein